MGTEVVHHHNLTLTQRGCQYPLDVCLEDRGSGRTLYGKRYAHPLHAYTRKRRSVLTAVARYRAVSPLSLLGPAVYRRKGDVCAHLILKNTRERAPSDWATITFQ